MEAGFLFDSLTDNTFLVVLHMVLDIIPSVTQQSFQKLRLMRVLFSQKQLSVNTLTEKLRTVKKRKGHFQNVFLELIESNDKKAVKLKKQFVYRKGALGAHFEITRINTVFSKPNDNTFS